MRSLAQVAEEQGSMAPISVPHVALPLESVQMWVVDHGGNVQRQAQPANTHQKSTFQCSSQQQGCGATFVGVYNSKKLTSLQSIVSPRQVASLSLGYTWFLSNALYS